MPPEFSFRLNGTVVPMLIINRERLNGKLTGRRQIAVWIEGVGRFTLDDDSYLWESTFPKHVLEYRNETEWKSADLVARRRAKNEGWCKVTPDELIGVLVQAGAISWE